MKMDKLEKFTFRHDEKIKQVYHEIKHIFDVDLIFQDIMPKVTMTLRIDRLTEDSEEISREIFEAAYNAYKEILSRKLYKQGDRNLK